MAAYCPGTTARAHGRRRHPPDSTALMACRDPGEIGLSVIGTCDIVLSDVSLCAPFSSRSLPHHFPAPTVWCQCAVRACPSSRCNDHPLPYRLSRSLEHTHLSCMPLSKNCVKADVWMMPKNLQRNRHEAVRSTTGTRWMKHVYHVSRVPLRLYAMWTSTICSQRKGTTRPPDSSFHAGIVSREQQQPNAFMTRKMANASNVQPTRALTGRTKPTLPPDVYGGQLCKNYRARVGATHLKRNALR